MPLVEILNKECDLGRIVDGEIEHPCRKKGIAYCEVKAYRLCEILYLTYNRKNEGFRRLTEKELNKYR